MEQDRIDAEIDANYDFFRRTLVDYLAEESGRFALIRFREIVGFYDDAGQADEVGRTSFDDGLFSIQKVMKEPVDFGFFSHAGR